MNHVKMNESISKQDFSIDAIVIINNTKCRVIAIYDEEILVVEVDNPDNAYTIWY